MLVKLPTVVKHLRNWSGRSQQTVNEQMPPELLPAMHRPSGSLVKLHFLPTSGRISSIRNVAYLSPSESYSTLRFRRGAARPSARFFGVSPSFSGLPPA